MRIKQNLQSQPFCSTTSYVLSKADLNRSVIFSSTKTMTEDVSSTGHGHIFYRVGASVLLSFASSSSFGLLFLLIMTKIKALIKSLDLRKLQCLVLCDYARLLLLTSIALSIEVKGRRETITPCPASRAGAMKWLEVTGQCYLNSNF